MKNALALPPLPRACPASSPSALALPPLPPRLPCLLSLPPLPAVRACLASSPCLLCLRCALALPPLPRRSCPVSSPSPLPVVRVPPSWHTIASARRRLPTPRLCPEARRPTALPRPAIRLSCPDLLSRGGSVSAEEARVVRAAARHGVAKLQSPSRGATTTPTGSCPAPSSLLLLGAPPRPRAPAHCQQDKGARQVPKRGARGTPSTRNHESMRSLSYGPGLEGTIKAAKAINKATKTRSERTHRCVERW